MSEICLSSLSEQDLLALLRVFFEYMRCAVSISRGDGIFMDANAECEASYGFSAKEYTGQPLEVLQDRGIFSPSVALQVIRKKRVMSTTLQDKDGFVRPIVGVPIFRVPGRVAYVICFSAWDITSYEELQVEYRRLEGELRRYSTEVRQLRAKEHAGLSLITENPAMREIQRLVAQIAPYKAPVLFSGEKGVGKAYLARRLHELGSCRTGPFIEFNCGTIPDGLAELELFGPPHQSVGSNILVNRVGALHLARGGTLLLKEVHALPLRAQSRLAALLAKVRGESIMSGQEPDSQHLADTEYASDVRIMASTDQDLKALSKSVTFREELYYALTSIPIEIPPLRQRPEDILAFILHFLEQTNSRYKLRKRLSQPAMDKLLVYGWPGNISEIRSLMERLLLTCPDVAIRLAHLPEYIRGENEIPDDIGLNLKKSLEFHERRIVLQAYETHNTTVALAKALGISQASAVRKLAKYNPKKNKPSVKS